MKLLDRLALGAKIAVVLEQLDDLGPGEHLAAEDRPTIRFRVGKKRWRWGPIPIQREEDR